MADLKTPFRYDYVGSFLRPEALKQARKNFEEGKITKEELTAVEDDCIRDLVGKIKKLGYHVITDGEFRRSTWHLDFMWGFQGIEHRKTVEGNTTFDAEAAMIDDTYMVGKISVKNHPFVEHFKFVKALEDENTVAKQTIPSPGQFYAYFTGAELLGTTLDIYGSEEAFAKDVAGAYVEFVNEIYAAGCRNLQFDDCVWGGMVNPKLAVALTGRKGDALEAYKKLLLQLNNEVAAQAPGLFLAGKDDLGLAAVGVLFGSLQAVVALLIAADVPAPAVEGRLGQIQPHLVGVTGIICGHYTAFHGLGSPYFFPRPNRLCSRPARLGRSAARCRGTGFTAAFMAAALGLDSAFGFSGLSVSCTKPFWK